LDRPTAFGKTEREQLINYFDQTENLRMFVRNSEIDNLPNVEEAKAQLSDESASAATGGPPKAG
jgi:hypothetical protein